MDYKEAYMKSQHARNRYPLDGTGRVHYAGVLAVILLTLLLAGITMMAPTCPAGAEPQRAAVAMPTPSPGISPASSPAPSAVPAGDAEMKKVQMITEKMEHLNPALKDWTSEVAIEAKLKLLLLVLPMDLRGRSYHKAPDKYKFELQDAPALLQRYQQVFGYRPVHLEDFIATMLADQVVKGRPTYVVRLDKKSLSSDFRSQTVWIDKETFTSPRRLYLYKDNGRIDVSFNWRKEGNYTVIDTMEALLDFPKLNGTAQVNAKYGGYQFDRGLDDHIFDEKKVSNSGVRGAGAGAR